jgi:hypothetical protein
MVDVGAIARQHGGVATWGFSQTDMSVLMRIFSDARTRWGICAALSANWIKYHAHGDSLANHLGGGGVGRLNTRKLSEIKALHAYVSPTTGGQQSSDLGVWLQMHGVLSKYSSRKIDYTQHKKGKSIDKWKGGSSLSDVSGGADQGPPINDIAGIMATEMDKLQGYYARVNFGGKAFLTSAGHAVAVWMGKKGEDAMLFDPNYGEFWFEKKKNMLTFFPAFYRATYLSGAMRFNRRWEVLPCAKAA